MLLPLPYKIYCDNSQYFVIDRITQEGNLESFGKYLIQWKVEKNGKLKPLQLLEKNVQYV